MKRFTLRMDDELYLWVEEVSKLTGLDRNQIIRLSIFSASESDVFKREINSRKQVDVSLPSPIWKGVVDGGPWRESEWKNKKVEGDVSVKSRQRRARTDSQFTQNDGDRKQSDVRQTKQVPRQRGEVYEPTRDITKNRSEGVFGVKQPGIRITLR